MVFDRLQYYNNIVAQWVHTETLRVFPVRNGPRVIRWDGAKHVMMHRTAHDWSVLCAWDEYGSLVEKPLGPRYVAPKPCSIEKLVSALQKLDDYDELPPDCVIAVNNVVRVVTPWKSACVRLRVDRAIATALSGAHTFDAVHDSVARQWKALTPDVEAWAWQRYMAWLAWLGSLTSDDEDLLLSSWVQVVRLSSDFSLT